eukprot:CAMPEP_0116835032 /NCGR_PEP_ID=MMETSP0418-20121206/7320_1 /TAXON_ID=1158023 /ORGANISM="Astrosyne radiata, Strain 13vi08-1A" /LENGTH=216 /DNA_ID=CAMNT_0004464655 /DNA_START=170 /DNA_END=820 /DNA_ORIENTATION=+
MVIREHFGNCAALPDDMKKKFIELRGTTAHGATDSKRYWSDSAVTLGMVDTPDGIIIEDSKAQVAHHQRDRPQTQSKEHENKAPPEAAQLLVQESDKAVVSEYLYCALSQVQRVRLTDSERVGNRKSMEIDSPGFGCRYCCAMGRKGMCRFFPARRRALLSKIKDLHGHLQRCTLCPEDVKRRLDDLRDSGVAKCGERERAFLDRLWARLHSDYVS